MMTDSQDMRDGHLRHITALKHRIELTDPNVRPIHCAPYRAGPKTRAVEINEIDRMIKLNIIEPTQMEWAAPIVFAPKKDGMLRFFVDYCRLNAVTIRVSYPIPKMDECIGALGDARVFSTLDAN